MRHDALAKDGLILEEEETLLLLFLTMETNFELFHIREEKGENKEWFSSPFGKTYYEAKFANTVVRAFLFDQQNST